MPSRSRMRASGPAAMIAGHLVYVRNQFGGYDPEKRPHDMPHVGRPDPRVEGLRSSRCRSPSSRNAIRPRSPRGSGPKASTPNTGDNAFEGSGIPAKSWIFAEGVPAEAGGHSRNSGGRDNVGSSHRTRWKCWGRNNNHSRIPYESGMRGSTRTDPSGP